MKVWNVVCLDQHTEDFQFEQLFRRQPTVDEVVKTVDTWMTGEITLVSSSNDQESLVVRQVVDPSIFPLNRLLIVNVIEQELTRN